MKINIHIATFIFFYLNLICEMSALLTGSIYCKVSVYSGTFFICINRFTPKHRAGEALSSGRHPWSNGGEGVQLWGSARQEAGALSPWGLELSAIVVLCHTGYSSAWFCVLQKEMKKKRRNLE